MMKAVSLTGLTSYREAHELQQKLVELRVQDQIADTVIFLEHYPVITRGRGLQFTGENRPKHIPLIAQPQQNIEVIDVERGGDLTYHGPGQLVIYPIFKIQDVNGFLRMVENILIQELKAMGLEAETKKNATGVWIAEKKIASMGIAVRKWVTYHGLAVNVVNDMEPFRWISPCGFSPEVMSRLSDYVGVDQKNWREGLETNLATRFQADAVIDVSCLDLLRDSSILFESSDCRETHPTSNL